jgi:hypothetical protein
MSHYGRVFIKSSSRFDLLIAWLLRCSYGISDQVVRSLGKIAILACDCPVNRSAPISQQHTFADVV